MASYDQALLTALQRAVAHHHKKVGKLAREFSDAARKAGTSGSKEASRIGAARSSALKSDPGNGLVLAGVQASVQERVGAASKHIQSQWKVVSKSIEGYARATRGLLDGMSSNGFTCEEVAKMLVCLDREKGLLLAKPVSLTLSTYWVAVPEGPLMGFVKALTGAAILSELAAVNAASVRGLENACALLGQLQRGVTATAVMRSVTRSLGSAPILNVGSGDNPHPRWANVELDPVKIEAARRLYPDARMWQGNAMQPHGLPFSDGTFVEVHSINPRRYQPVNAEVARVLMKRGDLKVTGNVFDNPDARLVSPSEAARAGFLPGVQGELDPRTSFGVQRKANGARIDPGDRHRTNTYWKR